MSDIGKDNRYITINKHKFRPNSVYCYSSNVFFSKPFNYRVTKDYIEFTPATIITNRREIKCKIKDYLYYFSFLMPYEIEFKKYFFDEESTNDNIKIYYNE